LIGTDRRGPKSITILEITPDGEIRVSALKAPDFKAAIDTHSLPEHLMTPNRVIRRIDTVPSGAVDMAK